MNSFNCISINRHRLSTDGAGITTLVGLHGCPLRCTYCINMDIFKKCEDNKKVKIRSPEELWEKLKIDYCYFVSTGGGITFGGGEPLIYEAALLQFINIIPEGVAVNIETSLNLETEQLEELVEKVDLLIIDIKSMNPRIYEQYTGKNNEAVIDNLKKIIAMKASDKCRIRIPIIPDIKDATEAERDRQVISEMGFTNIEVFSYVIRDYMAL